MKKETKEAYTTALTALILLWFFTLLAAFAFTGESGSARPGLIGDSFGALNALISICGFAAIVYTIQKEHQDGEEAEKRHAANLQLQKEILQLQQGVLKAQQNQSAVEVASLNIRLAERDMNLLFQHSQQRSELFRKHGETLHRMRHATGVNFGAWAATNLPDPRQMEFLYECATLNPALDVTRQASEQAQLTMKAYADEGTRHKSQLEEFGKRMAYWNTRLGKLSHGIGAQQTGGASQMG